MTDHAVLIPTWAGPVGAVVSEPDGPQRGALILLHGLGPPARAGVNALWTRIARDLAERGLLVLRFDFACEGESALAGLDAERGVGWRRSADLAILREAAPWFQAHSGEPGLLLAGSCHGGRIALEFAAADPTAVGLFLIVPYFWHRESNIRDSPEQGPADPQPVWAGGPTLDDDEAVIGGLRTALGRGPVWILAGEKEEEAQVRPFVDRLGPSTRPPELQVEPGIELHPFGHPTQQERVRRATVERLARVVAERPAPAAP